MSHSNDGFVRSRKPKGRSQRKAARNCPTGKQRYRSKDEALRTIHAAANSNSKVKPVRAYECDGCKGWHLTSQPGARG
jgi:hypothetical protein